MPSFRYLYSSVSFLFDAPISKVDPTSVLLESSPWEVRLWLARGDVGLFVGLGKNSAGSTLRLLFIIVDREGH